VRQPIHAHSVYHLGYSDVAFTFLVPIPIITLYLEHKMVTTRYIIHELDLPDGDSEMLNDKTSPSSDPVAAVRLLLGLQLSAYTNTCRRSGGHLTYARQYSFFQPAADGKLLLIIWCIVPFSFQPP